MAIDDERRPSIDVGAELAGYFVAHAVWCVAEGETLVPILAFQQRTGEREFRRLEGEEMQIEVARGQEWLMANPESAEIAALIYDGFVTLESGKTDALIAEIRAYGREPASLRIVIPYRHARGEGGFAVHRPKFLGYDGTADWSLLGEAFFRGVDQHEPGSAIWNAALDQTL
jgi:hypothetical protein